MQCKLKPLEAICVAGAVEDCLDRLRVLQSLTPNVITQRDELSNILGDTVSQLIDEQKKKELHYEQLIKQRSELKSLSNKTRYKQNQEEIEKQARELQDLTRDLCRRLRESPNVSENLLKIQNERSALISLFEAFREDLLQNKSFQWIAQWTNDRKSKYETMMQIIQTDKQMQKQIEDLSTSIQKTEQDMKTRIESLDTQIKEQKEQLIQIQSHNDAEKAQRDDERNAHLAAVAKMNQLSQSALTKQMRDAKMMLENEHRVHSETLAYFNRRRTKISEMSQEWQQKYESETKLKKTELRELTDRIEKATKEYEELKPKKEEAEQQLKLELERSKQRAKQNEILAEQKAFMDKVKLLYCLRHRIRGPLPKPKPKKKKRRRSPPK
ncbi:IQ motif, EF-hand binding site [Histomonas meleagridis]|uniref:IQ motif, EF-hand binding site n=1 Tax=Histomonas meleagridis TaxID=135588 RepID=UPI00355A6297|nr:IQ motif, EF-hand binding site [Histomonas meleagridis]KAH0800181.1 IQ motif, EF-hand binding site [Histomonas meleagridis]